MGDTDPITSKLEVFMERLMSQQQVFMEQITSRQQGLEEHIAEISRTVQDARRRPLHTADNPTSTDASIKVGGYCARIGAGPQPSSTPAVEALLWRRPGPDISKEIPSVSFFKRLTHVEMAERRAKGLCFNCDESYSTGHKCKRLFWIEVPDDNREGEEEGEVERLLSSEQKTTDYRTPDDGNAPDHRPTNACIRVVAYLSRVLESAFSALEGLNKQSFLTDLSVSDVFPGFSFTSKQIALCDSVCLLSNVPETIGQKWNMHIPLQLSDTGHALSVECVQTSGGLRLKRDITEYGEFVRSFNAPSIDEKFEQLSIVANAFIVAPESLASLFEGTPPSIRKDALRFIQLREDFKTAKISSMLHSFTSDS
ncbi:hypothetical protein ZIOFF_074983 [Zingiber officinale]|uniref:Exocyst complex component Sec10-like alpha-helical bundle domain-containing protein n=1 Tax=Zingiber officinale TaxID=94328 RepID=A0A8J5BUC8_ZINOF|nr:hypothetical protein ZIOFF_074983 [Zingiber officinale]